MKQLSEKECKETQEGELINRKTQTYNQIKEK